MFLSLECYDGVYVYVLKMIRESWKTISTENKLFIAKHINHIQIFTNKLPGRQIDRVHFVQYIEILYRPGQQATYEYMQHMDNVQRPVFY